MKLLQGKDQRNDLFRIMIVLCHFRPQLSVKGYNDKQHILLKKIIEKMATFEIDEKRFDIIKEAVWVGIHRFSQNTISPVYKLIIIQKYCN